MTKGSHPAMDATSEQSPDPVPTEDKEKLGPLEIQLGAFKVNINDDPELYAILEPVVARECDKIAATATLATLIQTVTTVRIATIKLGFVLRRAKLNGTSGVGLETLDAFHELLIAISSMTTARSAESPALIMPELSKSQVNMPELLKSQP